MMKLCKDCKFYKRDFLTWYTGRFAKCTRKDAVKPNLVTGHGVCDDVVNTYCSIERDFCGLCGPSGKFFESRE